MGRTFIARIIDLLFSRALVFLGSYIILSYYLNERTQVILISLSIVIIVHILLKMVQGKNKDKTVTKSKDEKHKKQCLNEFLFSSPSDNLSFFLGLVTKLNPTATKVTDHIEFTNKGEKNCAIVLMKSAQITTDDVLDNYKIFKETEVKSLIIFANSVPEEIHTLCEQLESPVVTVLDINDVYEVMKEKNHFPR